MRREDDGAVHGPYEVSNELAGTVNGPSVQAAQIHGGISFHVHVSVPSGLDTRPDQVPPLSFDFVNRTRDLARLDGWFGEQSTGASRVRFALVHGLHGVGKTSTVCRWAKLARELFPDGQIYLDFAALGGPMGGGDVSDAARWCLRAIGVAEDAIPAGPEERISLFRTHSARRRLLVIVENIRHPAQVRSLLPKGDGSAVLATSHARLAELALDGADLLELEPFDTESGLQLLAERSGRDVVSADPAAAERLVTFCGGLPEAISVLAGRLLTSPGLTVTRLARELADETGRLDLMALGEERSVAAVFDLGYRELPAEAARMYRLASWIPGGSFDAGAAAVAADVRPAVARRLLGTLEAAGFLDQAEDERYHFHDLARLHARARADREDGEEARRAVIRRVVTHYLVLTAFADRAIRLDRLRIAELGGLLADLTDPFATEDGPVPLDWLEAEHHNILQLLREAFRDGITTEVWQLSEAFTVLFLHHRHLAVWREALEIGAEAAAADPFLVPAAEARLRSLLSRPLMDLGEYEAAHAALTRAAACADVSGHLVVQASVAEFTGRYWEHADPARALAEYGQALDLSTRAGEMRGAALAAYFLGRVQDGLGDHVAALVNLRRAHRDLLDRGDRRMAARVVVALAAVHGHTGETDEMISHLESAVRELSGLEARHYEAEARLSLADALQHRGADRDAVRAHLLAALEIYEAEGSPEAERVRLLLERPDDLDGGAAGPD